MVTFHDCVYFCVLYILVNDVAYQHAFNFGRVQVLKKYLRHRNNELNANISALNNLLMQRIYHKPPNHYVPDTKVAPARTHIEAHIVHENNRAHQIHAPSLWHAPDLRRLKPRRKDLNEDDLFAHPPDKVYKEIRLQRGGMNRPTAKHFRYSRIRRYYTLSTASMTTYKKINYTTRTMIPPPTTTTTIRYTDPPVGVTRQTILHTRMTESDEIGRDRFLSGSIEYKEDSFDKPPTAMVAYDSVQQDEDKPKNITSTTTTKPTGLKSTQHVSSELISLGSSSEEKSSSLESKDEESEAEGDDYGTEKLYGEYGYQRKHNMTAAPFTLLTYANLGEVPGMEEMNFTSKEIAFWEANASWIIEKYFPSSELEIVSNYSEETLVRSFFHSDNIEPHHLDFYKWYYKLLTNPERLRIVYNRTVLDEPDYKNLSQYTPFAIPDDLQRYYMFINQIENEINKEKRQEELMLFRQKEQEKNLANLLGSPAEDRAKKFVPGQNKDPDVSQILHMVDNQQSDSMLPDGIDSEGNVDALKRRRKREARKWEKSPNKKRIRMVSLRWNSIASTPLDPPNS